MPNTCEFNTLKICLFYVFDTFFNPNKVESIEDLIMNLGNYLFEYNHLRGHDGGSNYQTPFDKLIKSTELLS